MATPEAICSDRNSLLTTTTRSWRTPSPDTPIPPSSCTRLLILSEAPLLAWGIQTCLAGLLGLAVAFRSPEEEVSALLAEEHPDVVIVATMRARLALCQELQTAQQLGWVRTVICLPTAEIGCSNAPGHRALPLLGATPPEVRQLVTLAMGKRKDREAEGGPIPLPLTEREKEIGRLVVAGLSSQEIGRRLFISPRTVEKHRANIMEKLAVSNAAALTLELIYLDWQELGAAAETWTAPTERVAEPEPALLVA